VTPRATYRLQFTPDFGFDDAAALAPYLAKLGVSHLYASPYLKARPGSQHGYDIVDHNALNPELGDAAAFARMNEALRRHGLKQILDFVPNHVGVGGADNPFWLDVLEWGRDSIYAGWFDIDWDNDKAYLREKLLVPFLGGQYGAELVAGTLALKFDAETGAFAVWAYDSHKLPVSPNHYAKILGVDHPVLERLGDAFAHMASWRPRVPDRAEALKDELASAVRSDAGVAEAVAAAVARFAGTTGDAASWEPLNRLIRAQPWRVAHFKVAADDINYRRFFNINDLAGLRMEIPVAFDHAHRLVFSLMREGVVDGLRIDHVDGLFDPKAYLDRLRQDAPHAAGSDWYLIVEKILGEREALRPDWPVQGTTGYEVTNLLLGLMVDPAAEASFTRTYEAFIEGRPDYARILRSCKKRIMDNEMASELDRLARSAARIARQVPATEDFTRGILRRALREIVACFGVYRTYVDGVSAPTGEDREELRRAIEAARPNERAIDASVYDFLEQALIGDLARPRGGYSRMAVLRFAMKIQQYSGPVMAKGLEDTAFYRYNRFIALNEVGGHPDHFGVDLDNFHAANRDRAVHWPATMLGTSTHDTKRGEDVRARLAVLSEIPTEWHEAVFAWSRVLRDAGAGGAPDRNDEYALLQWLVGTWPVELLEGDDPEILTIYAERLKGTMTKAMREAKVHTTWAMPDEAYESGTLGFVDAALTGPRSDAFLQAFRPFARKIARLGARNSIVQSVLKLTLPGVPDLYQGTELWDLSMVDPDNRRAVDFPARERMLDAVEGEFRRDRSAAMASFVDAWEDGRIKLAVIATLLAFRRDHPALFAEGGYEAAVARGPEAQRICAFERRAGGETMIVAVARFPGRCEAQAWRADAGLSLDGSWTDLLSGRTLTARDGTLSAAQIFDILPAAVLVPAGYSTI
jgi:(1->4)-alpha-D-glucan 1-alpha-D-glucosylmutase